MARRVRPERKLKGRGAQRRAIPLAVLSEYRGVSLRNGCTCSGSSKSSSSSITGSDDCTDQDADDCIDQDKVAHMQKGRGRSWHV